MNVTVFQWLTAKYDQCGEHNLTNSNIIFFSSKSTNLVAHRKASISCLIQILAESSFTVGMDSHVSRVVLSSKCLTLNRKRVCLVLVVRYVLFSRFKHD